MNSDNIALEKIVMMKRIKGTLGTCLLLAVASALSGCIVVPYGHGHGGYYRNHH